MLSNLGVIVILQFQVAVRLGNPFCWSLYQCWGGNRLVHGEGSQMVIRAQRIHQEGRIALVIGSAIIQKRGVLFSPVMYYRYARIATQPH